MAWGITLTRKAGPRDADAILEIVQLAREESPLSSQLCTPDSDRLTEQLGMWLDHEKSHLLVAEAEERVVGFALAQVNDTSVFADITFMQIEALFVHPEFRRRGVGRSVMGEVANLAREVDAARVVTSVLSGARHEQRFLAGLGFAPAGSRRIIDTDVLARRVVATETLRERRVRGLDELIARRRRSRDLTTTS